MLIGDILLFIVRGGRGAVGHLGRGRVTCPRCGRRCARDKVVIAERHWVNAKKVFIVATAVCGRTTLLLIKCERCLTSAGGGDRRCYGPHRWLIEG